MESSLVQKRAKKAPQVRQTLTSKLRFLKTNPLLRYELQNKLNSTTDNPEVVAPLASLVSLMEEPSRKPAPKKTESCPNLGAIRKTCKAPVPKHTAKKIVPASTVAKTPQKLLVPTPLVITEKSQKLEVPTSSVVTTPMFRRQSVHPKTPHSDEMVSRLNKWLKSRGKSFGEFQHLKCFGVHKRHCETKPDKENKPNNIIPEIEMTKSLEQVNNNQIEKEEVTVQDTLQDLHKLILDGYPPEQCDIWLKLIRNKFREVEEEPEYWECRAALEQTKGNLNLAVECYKTAIIQGAEVKVVDKCLDQLLHKFSLLDINESNCRAPERSKIVEDARNVFKSSIIQFAVQERTFKKKNKDGFTIEKKMIATPVRRSTRVSRAAYISTPGVQIYSTLQDVDDSVRKTLNFQCNNALREL